MGMQGNLKDMAVADLVQHNCQDRRTTALTIQHADQQVVLYFKDGNISHAVLDDVEGEEVVYRILGWEEGTFNLETGVEPPKVSVTRSWSGLLLEGARRLDESQEVVKDREIRPTEMDQTEVTQMTQKLDDVLKELSGEVAGYVASAVVGMDGLSIAQHAKGKVDPEAVSAQLTLLFKLVDTSVTKLGSGVLEDDLLTTQNSYLLMRYLPDKQYFLGMAVDRKTGNLGNMRLMSKMYVDRLNKVMPR